VYIRKQIISCQKDCLPPSDIFPLAEGDTIEPGSELDSDTATIFEAFGNQEWAEWPAVCIRSKTGKSGKKS